MQAGQSHKPRNTDIVKDDKGRSHTPISSFLVHLSLDDRMSALSRKHSSQQTKIADNVIFETEMSALLGSSPQLRRQIPRKGASTGARKGPGSKTRVTEDVNTIAKPTMMMMKEYKTNIKSYERGELSNNNSLCGRADSTSLYTEMGTYPEESSKPVTSQLLDSSNIYQEMGTHPDESSRPMTPQLSHHMIKEISIEPMRNQNEIHHQIQRKSSHLSQPDVSE